MKQVVFTSQAPAAIGPYSQAIRAGEWLFLSGQIPVDPATGEVAGTDVRTQARQVLKNIQAVLAEAGTTVQAVVKTTVFLKDLQDFQAFNEEYAKVFASEAPARSCVEIARLPKDVLVEIEAIALVKP
ncbi:MAG: RidA family protein [Anaeromusa sp.]|uniref:RidA family protein n=1 Tax=Anaeromusa sp. TaxID=1872520 RepID=UPI002A0A9EC4|nr:RidA family protein [Anaeromusa sp.]MEA4836268.1 RidA family protein [Anaeromusa sp.]NCB75592.1 RidA family protein [Negativicutes bacterium]